MSWDESYRKKYAEYCNVLKQEDEDGKKYFEKQHSANKLTVRERLELLFDDDSFCEIDSYCSSATTDYSFKNKKYPGDGVITGWGTIGGETVYVAAQNVSILGGSLGRVHGDKICRIQDMAYENKKPIVFLIDSGGARVEEGVAGLSGYSEIFFRNTKCSGVIPQFALLLGYSVGGSSYLPAMCDFTFMTKFTSKMFITGPGVVKEVIGETVSADELGGAKMHSEISGAADFIYENDTSVIENFKVFFSYISHKNMEFMTSNPEANMCEYIENIVSDDQRKSYDVKDVIDCFVDKGSFFEIKENYAKNIVIGLSRMQGKTVAIVANQPMILGGSLSSSAAEKAARFIRFCDCFNIPIVTLVDTPGFYPGKKQEEDGIIRRGAKLLYAYSEATVPKITLVMRKAYGGAYIAMNSKCMGADLVYAWPIAQLAVLGPEGAVNVVFRKEILNANDPDEERRKRITEYKELFLNPYYAAKQGYVDEIILPEYTRVKLLDALLGLNDKKIEFRCDRKHGNISL